MTATPEGPSTATIVFTDMVGSTALRSELGEERADVLRRVHDRLLVERVEANRGRVLKAQGDGIMAAFPSASDGLTAAVQMQQALASYSRRPDALAEIHMRIGLSVGDVSWEGGDAFGTPVVEAARLEAAAGGDQILCSEFVRLMARGRGGHEFVPIGFLELKGLPEPLPACEVVWAPTPDEPPLPLPPELAVEQRRTFVSRDAERATVDEVVSDTGRSRLAVVWLLGEPGIGKSRLATEVARRVHSAGGVVLFGRCSEDIAVPYQPLLEALRWYVAQVPAHELRDRLGPGAGELVRLAPEVAEHLPGAVPAPTTSPEVEMHRLFEAVRGWLAGAGAGRPLVAVLDDVHWATRPTVALLGHLCRSAESSPAVLVCTARNTSPDTNEALADLIGELGRHPGVSHRIELGGLSPEAVAEFLPADGGVDLTADELHRETGGNPLYLDTVLASAAGHGATPGEQPRTLVETVGRRVTQLPEEVASVLRTAAVVGLDFDVPVAARAAGVDELDVVDDLELAERAGLVHETGVDRYRFSHGLVRSALVEGLSRSRRTRVHLAAGEAIEAVHAGALEEHAAALAFHFGEAVPAGGGPKAHRYSLLAADRAARLLSYDEAADHYHRALELLAHAEAPGPSGRYDLLAALGEAQRAAANLNSAAVTWREAAADAEARNSAEELARAAVAFQITSLWQGQLGGEQLALLQRAEKMLDPADSELRVLTVVAISRTLLYMGRRADRVEWASEALAMAARLGDPAIEVAALVGTSVPYVNVSEVAAAEAQWAEARRRALDIDDDDSVIHATWMLLLARAQMADLDAVEVLLAEYDRLAGMRWPIWRQILLPFRSFLAAMAGDLDTAEALLDQAQEVGEGRGWIAEGLIGVAMFLFRREQGRLAELLPAIRAIARLEVAGVWRPGLAALYAELGLLEESRSEFERLAADGFAAIPDDAGRDLCLGLLAEVCSALGDAERASWLIEALLPCEGRLLVFMGSAACLGPTDRLLARLAGVAGRHDDAARWHASGLATARRLRSPLWTAHCLYDSAAHRLGGHRDTAVAMLAEAAELCQRHRLDGLAPKVTALLDLASS